MRGILDAPSRNRALVQGKPLEAGAPVYAPDPALARFRAKYPQYRDLDDQTLARLVLRKYPQYRDVLGPLLAQAVQRGYQWGGEVEGDGHEWDPSSPWEWWQKEKSRLPVSSLIPPDLGWASQIPFLLMHGAPEAGGFGQVGELSGLGGPVPTGLGGFGFGDLFPSLSHLATLGLGLRAATAGGSSDLTRALGSLASLSALGSLGARSRLLPEGIGTLAGAFGPLVTLGLGINQLSHGQPGGGLVTGLGALQTVPFLRSLLGLPAPLSLGASLQNLGTVLSPAASAANAAAAGVGEAGSLATDLGGSFLGVLESLTGVPIRHLLGLGGSAAGPAAGTGAVAAVPAGGLGALGSDFLSAAGLGLTSALGQGAAASLGSTAAGLAAGAGVEGVVPALGAAAAEAGVGLAGAPATAGATLAVSLPSILDFFFGGDLSGRPQHLTERHHEAQAKADETAFAAAMGSAQTLDEFVSVLNQWIPDRALAISSGGFTPAKLSDPKFLSALHFGTDEADPFFTALERVAPQLREVSRAVQLQPSDVAAAIFGRQGGGQLPDAPAAPPSVESITQALKARPEVTPSWLAWNAAPSDLERLGIAKFAPGEESVRNINHPMTDILRAQGWDWKKIQEYYYQRGTVLRPGFDETGGGQYVGGPVLYPSGFETVTTPQGDTATPPPPAPIAPPPPAPIAPPPPAPIAPHGLLDVPPQVPPRAPMDTNAPRSPFFIPLGSGQSMGTPGSPILDPSSQAPHLTSSGPAGLFDPRIGPQAPPMPPLGGGGSAIRDFIMTNPSIAGHPMIDVLQAHGWAWPTILEYFYQRQSLYRPDGSTGYQGGAVLYPSGFEPR